MNENADRTVLVARAGWRSAEAELFPALIADPHLYQRTVEAVRLVAGELRSRCADSRGLLEQRGRAEEVVAAAAVDVAVPPPVLVAVASALLDREFAAERGERDRRRAIDEARAAGRAWAAWEGPAEISELTAGRSVAIHVPSGTVVTAEVLAWSPAEPYLLRVDPPGGGPDARTYADRNEWLDAHDRSRSAVEAHWHEEAES
ncbi:hypothetical protein [Pseudonocardia sp.]|uniref:hypothetical protein n=1 Tax=Pseudonocardia sp. TaxID=60912 RepID=UPI003D136A92